MAVAFLNTNVVLSGTTSISGSQTVNATGANRCAIILITMHGAAGKTVSTVTYGGQTCTAAGALAFNSSSSVYAVIYYLANPPTGGNTLAISTTNSPSEIKATLTAFTGVDQSNPIRASTYQALTGNSPDTGNTAIITVTSNANDKTITVINPDGAQITTSSQTRDVEDTGGTDYFACDHSTTSGATVVHTWSSGSSQYALCGLSVQEVQAGAPTTNSVPLLMELRRARA